MSITTQGEYAQACYMLGLVYGDLMDAKSEMLQEDQSPEQAALAEVDFGLAWMSIDVLAEEIREYGIKNLAEKDRVDIDGIVNSMKERFGRP